MGYEFVPVMSDQGKIGLEVHQRGTGLDRSKIVKLHRLADDSNCTLLPWINGSYSISHQKITRVTTIHQHKVNKVASLEGLLIVVTCIISDAEEEDAISSAWMYDSTPATDDGDKSNFWRYWLIEEDDNDYDKTDHSNDGGGGGGGSSSSSSSSSSNSSSSNNAGDNSSQNWLRCSLQLNFYDIGTLGQPMELTVDEVKLRSDTNLIDDLVKLVAAYEVCLNVYFKAIETSDGSSPGNCFRIYDDFGECLESIVSGSFQHDYSTRTDHYLDGQQLLSCYPALLKYV